MDRVGIWHNGKAYVYVAREDCRCPRVAEWDCIECRDFTMRENKGKKQKAWRKHSLDCLFCEVTRIYKPLGGESIIMPVRLPFSPDDLQQSIEIARQRLDYLIELNTGLVPGKPEVVEVAVALIIDRYLDQGRHMEEFFYPEALKPFTYGDDAQKITYHTLGRLMVRNKHLLRYPDKGPIPGNGLEADIYILGNAIKGQTAEIFLGGYMPQWAWKGYARNEGASVWGEGMAVYRGPLMPMPDVLEGLTHGYKVTEEGTEELLGKHKATEEEPVKEGPKPRKKRAAKPRKPKAATNK